VDFGERLLGSELMLAFLRSTKKYLIDRDTVVAVPAMDGPFKPNNHLEQAQRLFALPDVDNLALTASAAYCTSGSSLYRIDVEAAEAAPVEVKKFDAPVTFLAVDADDGLAVGVESDGVHIGDGSGPWKRLTLAPALAACMTAGTFLPDGGLLICIGSMRNRTEDWKRDLMELGSTGMAIVIDLANGTVREIASGLAFPYGAISMLDGSVAISESWKHRVIGISPSAGGGATTILDDLPGYPARMAKASDGGFWLTLFAPRRQLFELLLIEDDFRREMVSSIDASEWIGPDLRFSDAPDQPLQQGSVRQMGHIKPWAPSRSYGMIIRCDKVGNPIKSWHSRADGSLHGVTSVVEWRDSLLVASKGAGVVARVSTLGADHD
jgi:hypothetical protein